MIGHNMPQLLCISNAMQCNLVKAVINRCVSGEDCAGRVALSISCISTDHWWVFHFKNRIKDLSIRNWCIVCFYLLLVLGNLVLDIFKSLCSTLVAHLVATAVWDVRRGRSPWSMSFICDKLSELLDFMVSFVKTMFSVRLRSPAYLFSLRSCRMCVSVFSYVDAASFYDIGSRGGTLPTVLSLSSNVWCIWSCALWLFTYGRYWFSWADITLQGMCEWHCR